MDPQEETQEVQINRLELCRSKLLPSLREFAVKVSHPEAEPFRLASGQLSRVYIDTRPVAMSGVHSRLISEVLYLTIEHMAWKVDAVAGVVLGGCHMASSLAQRSGNHQERPYHTVYVRSALKEHGVGSWVVGPPLGKTANVLVIEDVLTTGRSAARAIGHLEDEGYHVIGVLALVDRSPHGGVESIDNCFVHSIFQLKDLVDGDIT